MGQPRSPEVRRKISEAMRRRYAEDAEYRARQQAGCQRAATDEKRRRISVAIKLKYDLDPAYRARQRAGKLRQLEERRRLGKQLLREFESVMKEIEEPTR